MAAMSEDRTATSDGALSDDDTKKDDVADVDLDDRIDVLKAQIDAIEAEADKLRTANADAAAPVAEKAELVDEVWRQRMEVDSRSIYVGQVDYGTTPEELAEVLQDSGTVSRVTILCNKWTGHPKGYAYVEFEELVSVERSLRHNGQLFRGRYLKVAPKRTNYPWWMGMGKGKGKGRQAGGVPSYMRGRGGWWTPYYAPYYSPFGGWRGRGKGKGRGRGVWY